MGDDARRNVPDGRYWACTGIGFTGKPPFPQEKRAGNMNIKRVD